MLKDNGDTYKTIEWFIETWQKKEINDSDAFPLLFFSIFLTLFLACWFILGVLIVNEIFLKG